MSEPLSGTRPGAGPTTPVTGATDRRSTDPDHPESDPTAATPGTAPAATGPQSMPTADTAAPGTGSPAYGTPPIHGTPATYGTPPSYGTQPTYGTQPSYGSPAGHPTPPAYPSPGTPGPMNPSEERNWALAAHLSSFVAAYVALGFIGPLVVMLAVGNRSPYVRRHAVEALNFNLSVLLYAIASAVLVLLLIGIPMLLALGLLYLVATIQGAIAASRGQDYRYPLTIRFVS